MNLRGSQYFSFKTFVFISLFTGFGIAISNPNEKQIVIMKVNHWSDAHNSKSLDMLSNLYDSKVQYYGSDYSRDKCIADKKRLFSKHPKFSQSIVSNIDVTKLNNGEYLCQFNKRVFLNGSTKDYPSYLHLRQVSGQWAIVLESDKVTDNIKNGRKAEQTASNPTKNQSGSLPTVSDVKNFLRGTWYIVEAKGEDVEFLKSTGVNMVGFEYRYEGDHCYHYSPYEKNGYSKDRIIVKKINSSNNGKFTFTLEIPPSAAMKKLGQESDIEVYNVIDDNTMESHETDFTSIYLWKRK
jgi:hypothetical protein